MGRLNKYRQVFIVVNRRKFLNKIISSKPEEKGGAGGDEDNETTRYWQGQWDSNFTPPQKNGCIKGILRVIVSIK